MNILPNEMTNSPARSYASTRTIPTLSSWHEKSLKTGTPFGLIIMGSTPPPSLPAETEETKQGGGDTELEGISFRDEISTASST